MRYARLVVMESEVEAVPKDPDHPEQGPAQDPKESGQLISCDMLRKLRKGVEPEAVIVQDFEWTWEIELVRN